MATVGGLALSFLTTAFVLTGDTAFAAGNEPEICRRAKALGYDESKDLFLKYITREPNKQGHCTKRFWELFRPRPLSEIFRVEEHAQYRQAIDSGACRRAAELLSKRFDAAHPGAPPHRIDRSSRFSWQGSMSHHFYDSLGLCKALRSLRRSLKDIDAAGLKPRPFWSWRKNYFGAETKFPPPVREMYSTVARLLRNMGRTRSPKVALAVLRISNEGRALKLHPHYEVYIARRLRELGVSDPLLDQIISRPLDAKASALIAEQVKRKVPGGIPSFPGE